MGIVTDDLGTSCCICDSDAELTIVTDYYASETSWKIEIDDESCGAYFEEGGPYADGDTEYTHTLTNLCDGFSYTFTIADTAYDGICCLHGDGFYNLMVDDEVVVSGGEFNNNESKIFTLENTPCPSSEPTASPTSTPTGSPTPYPSSHPTPSATCVDDSSWYKDDSTAKDCVWVGKKKNKRCSKRSNSANGMIPASSACKASCNTCFTPTTFPTIMPTPCGDSDSTTWHKWGNPNKDCDWAAKRPNKRCSVGSMKLDDGAYGNFAKEECRAACCDY